MWIWYSLYQSHYPETLNQKSNSTCLPLFGQIIRYYLLARPIRMQVVPLVNIYWQPWTAPVPMRTIISQKTKWIFLQPSAQWWLQSAFIWSKVNHEKPLPHTSLSLLSAYSRKFSSYGRPLKKRRRKNLSGGIPNSNLQIYYQLKIECNVLNQWFRFYIMWENDFYIKCRDYNYLPWSNDASSSVSGVRVPETYSWFLWLLFFKQNISLTLQGNGKATWLFYFKLSSKFYLLLIIFYIIQVGTRWCFLS